MAEKSCVNCLYGDVVVFSCDLKSDYVDENMVCSDWTCDGYEGS